MELSEAMNRRIQRIVEDVTLELAEKIISQRSGSVTPPPQQPQPKQQANESRHWLDVMMDEIVIEKSVKRGRAR